MHHVIVERFAQTRQGIIIHSNRIPKKLSRRDNRPPPYAYGLNKDLRQHSATLIALAPVVPWIVKGVIQPHISPINRSDVRPYFESPKERSDLLPVPDSATGYEEVQPVAEHLRHRTILGHQLPPGKLGVCEVRRVIHVHVHVDVEQPDPGPIDVLIRGTDSEDSSPAISGASMIGGRLALLFSANAPAITSSRSRGCRRKAASEVAPCRGDHDAWYVEQAHCEKMKVPRVFLSKRPVRSM